MGSRGGKGAESGPGGDRKSRRDRGTEAREKPKPDPFAPKRLIVNGIIVLLVLALLFFAWRDAGATNNLPGAGANVDEWRLIVTDENGDDTVLCGDHEECDINQLWTARLAELDCRIEARLHMNSSDNPMILTRIGEPTFNMTGFAGDPAWDGEGVNFTRWGTDVESQWVGGWWWRAFPKFLDLSFLVPCDAWTFQAQMDIEGRTWTGAAWSAEHNTAQVVHTQMRQVHGDGQRPGNETQDPEG